MARFDPRTVLLDLLNTGRPLKLPELAERMGVSTSTATRALEALGEDRVLSVGERRGRRYFGRRQVGDLASHVPIFRVLDDGKSEMFASLTPVGTSSFYVEFQGAVPGEVHDDLPGFLAGLVPSGYLDDRRGAPLPSADALLMHLHDNVHDGFGEFIIGRPAFQKYLQTHQTPLPVVQDSRRAALYPQLAAGTLSSSSGALLPGDHPKFLTETAERGRVLVKFSPPLNQHVGRRFADLLVAEHLALETLRAAGIRASASEIILTPQQLFLQIERFDRTPLGRKGALSLRTLAERAGLNPALPWADLVGHLATRKQVPDSMVSEVRLLSAFGRLIADTDLSSAHLSFITRGLSVEALAPAYGLSPALYRPRAGHVISPELSPPMPEAGDGPIWEAATQLATYFWEQLSRYKAVSPEFRRIAKNNIEVVRQSSRLAGRLPNSNTSAARRIKRSLAARKARRPWRGAPLMPA